MRKIQMVNAGNKRDLRRIDVGDIPVAYYRVEPGQAEVRFAREQGFNDAAMLDRKAEEYQARIKRIDQELRSYPYERAQDRNGVPSRRPELLRERSEAEEMLKEVNLAKKYFDKPVVVKLPDFKPEDVQKRISANNENIAGLRKLADGHWAQSRRSGKYLADPDGGYGNGILAQGYEEKIKPLEAENRALASQGIRFLQNEAVIKEIAQAKYDERYPSSSLLGNTRAGVEKLSTGSAIAVMDFGAFIGIDGAEEWRDQLEKDYAEINTVHAGAQRREIEGGLVNEVLMASAENVPQMLLKAAPTALATRALVKTGAGSLGTALPMAPFAYGADLQDKHQQADNLEKMARAMQADLDAKEPPSYEGGGAWVDDPREIEETKAAISNALSDAQKLRSGARASAAFQALINTGTEMISPAHAQGVGRGRLTRMARRFIVEGVLKEGFLEEGTAQALTNLVEPLVTQGVNQPGLLDGMVVSIATGGLVGGTHAAVMTTVTPGSGGAGDAGRGSAGSHSGNSPENARPNSAAHPAAAPASETGYEERSDVRGLQRPDGSVDEAKTKLRDRANALAALVDGKPLADLSVEEQAALGYERNPANAPRLTVPLYSFVKKAREGAPIEGQQMVIEPGLGALTGGGRQFAKLGR